MKEVQGGQSPQHGPIGVIHTGGTFGMLPSADGYAPAANLPERVEQALSDCGAHELPAIEWLDHGWPALDSADIPPSLWYDLALTIAGASDHCTGFVVIHGSDTLAFTGSALSFLLAGLQQPVIVTGASTPLGQPQSDALDNLVQALRVLGAGRCREVGVVFRNRLLRANRTTKRHGRPDAPFTSPCVEPLAELGTTICWRNDVSALPIATPLQPTASAARAVRVAVLPVYPGITAATLRAVAESAPEGVVLEGYPSGIGPGADADFVAALSDIVASGTVVAGVSQGCGGHIRMGRYASSAPLARAGLIGGADLTREAALAKLHVLCSAGLDPAARADAFGRNMCGEITAP
jgi:L-asparaginase